jgi:hypothetical protein
MEEQREVVVVYFTTVSVANYIVSNGRMIDELERIRKEAVMA